MGGFSEFFRRFYFKKKQVFFNDFTKVLSNFLFYSRFLEDLSMANSVSFKKSFQKLKPAALGKELSPELT